jgi:hypothetical protein
METRSAVLTSSTNPSDSSPPIHLDPHPNTLNLIAVNRQPSDMYVYMDNAEAPTEMADMVALSQ